MDSIDYQKCLNPEDPTTPQLSLCIKCLCCGLRTTPQLPSSRSPQNTTYPQYAVGSVPCINHASNNSDSTGYIYANNSSSSEGVSVADSFLDHISNNNFDSWANGSQTNAVFDTFGNGLFSDDFGLVDYSIDMVNHLNYLSTSTSMDQASVPYINVGDAQLNSALDSSYFGFNHVNDSQQLINIPIAGSAMPGPTQTLALAVAPRVVHYHRCNFPSCIRRFKRPSDLARHQYTFHFNLQGHLCPIIGCPKAIGNGYSRADKVTEHLWRKHGDLGYVKTQG